MKRNIQLKRSGFARKSYAEILETQKSKKHAPRSPKLRSKGVKVKKPTISHLKKKLWALCRTAIREKWGNTCFTCGRIGLSGGNWQTGHFIPSSICSVELRYSLENLRPQCYHCNINLSGNWIEYEKKLGEEATRLKRLNEETKGRQYDILWYLAEIEKYKQDL